MTTLIGSKQATRNRIQRAIKAAQTTREPKIMRVLSNLIVIPVCWFIALLVASKVGALHSPAGAVVASIVGIGIGLALAGGGSSQGADQR